MDVVAMMAICAGVLVLPVVCRWAARRFQSPDVMIDTLIRRPTFTSSPNADRILRMKARK